MLITKVFTFDSAHALTEYHGKCERLHGHTYKLEVTIEGEMKDDGMVMDFVELKKVVNREVIDKLDHQNLNDLFKNPSSELVAKWVFEQVGAAPELAESEVKVHSVKLWETATSAVTYCGA